MEMDNQLYSTLSQRTMFYLQYDYRSFDFHPWVSSNKQCFHDEIHVFFFHCDYSFHDLSHLLQTLFLQPLHSTHDRHPLQRTFSHSPTYDLRSSCLFLSYFNCILTMNCEKKNSFLFYSKPVYPVLSAACMYEQAKNEL